MTVAYNKNTLIRYRKNLRLNTTPAELRLWGYLKGKQLKGYKFRRQYSITNYIVDFYCVPLKLAIEIDGDTHFGEQEHIQDLDRQKQLAAFGVKILRFTNQQVFDNLDGVLTEIHMCLP